jgi:hypothetical protein
VASVLTSIKKSLGIDEDYTAFDIDIVMYINAVFSTLNQLGVGPEEGFLIEDKDATWETFLGTDPRLNFIPTYMLLKVRLLFDPPATSFAIDAVKSQIAEYEWLINVCREVQIWPDPVVVVPEE